MARVPPPPYDLWIDQIGNRTTRERARRQLCRTYEVAGELCHGAGEVHERLQALGYSDMTLDRTNHLVNHGRLAPTLREAHPELDPSNPDGIVQLVSEGRFHDRWTLRKCSSKFVLVYYFENPEHERFYGVSGKKPDTIWKDFQHALGFLHTEDRDPSRYEFHAVDVVEIDGSLRVAYDVADRAMVEYVADNPGYEAYSINPVKVA